MMITKIATIAVALGAFFLALTGCSLNLDDQKGPASPSSTAAASETPKYTAEEQAFVQQVRAANNFVAADDEDDLIAAGHAWCDNRVPGASPTNATLSAQIESKYPIVGTLGSFPGWQPTATTTMCPEMDQ
jgi:uncharacterized protein DUF732